MPTTSDIARLNVLIELFSECAGAADLEALLQTAAGRLRWVIEFDRCAFALTRGEDRACWVGTRAEETLRRVPRADLHASDAALIDEVIDRGAPAGQVRGSICVPIQVGGRTTGAICFATAAGGYAFRDLRLGHHAGQFLGSLISRLDLEDETRRLSRRKDDVLALLSHELRNPLAPIVAAVHILKARAAGQPSRELAVIERQAQHLVRLVDDLLDVARLTRGKVALQRAPVELARVVARAVEMVTPLLDQRRHELRIDVPAAGLVVDGDENRLVQVVSNLLSNAAHYTPPGGRVGVVARREGEAVVLAVSDSGVGIAAGAQASIFDLFVQGHDRSDGHAGLGLGLVVVKQLTELHGGSVAVASACDGSGTTFTVRLPLVPSVAVVPTASAAPLVEPPPPPAAPQRVLMVDDNEDALELLADLVREAGHEVVAAPSGRAALAVLDGFHPAVAVIDLGMPVMDGYALAARVRAHPRGAGTFLVALTGFGQASDRARTRAAGFDAHLVKPVDHEALLRVIAGARAPSIAPSA